MVLRRKVTVAANTTTSIIGSTCSSRAALLCALLATSWSAAAFMTTSSARPAKLICAGSELMILNVAGGKGFGNKPSGKGIGGDKTYGEVATIKDVIDVESAMKEFFSSTEEWHPLFRYFATNSSVPATAMSFLGNTKAPDGGSSDDEKEGFDFLQTKNAPWKRLDGVPTDESDRQVLASVLDSMQASLVDIPVDEETKEDENDLHFLEEGRRILAISRFQVLQGVRGGCVDSYDTLFSTCWSELMELHVTNEESTGSLIVVPDYEITDLRRFTDINLLRPLEWLGVQADFEVTSLHRGSPAIRLLHKLQDMPTEPWKDPEEEDE